MLARSAGVPVKAFLAGYRKHPFTYFSKRENPIKAPRDMIEPSTPAGLSHLGGKS